MMIPAPRRDRPHISVILDGEQQPGVLQTFDAMLFNAEASAAYLCDSRRETILRRDCAEAIEHGVTINGIPTKL